MGSWYHHVHENCAPPQLLQTMHHFWIAQTYEYLEKEELLEEENKEEDEEEEVQEEEE